MTSRHDKFSDDMQGFQSPYNIMNMGGMGGMGMNGFGPSPYMDRGMMPHFQGGYGNDGGSGSMRPSYMSPGGMRSGGGYGNNYGPGQESMGFDPRMRGEMGSGGGQTPSEDPQMMGGWGGFNQQEQFLRMRFDRGMGGGPYNPHMYGGMVGGGQYSGGMHPNQGGDRGFGRQGANGSDNGGGGGNYGAQQGYSQGPEGPSPIDRNQAHVESAPPPPPQGNGNSADAVSNNKTENSQGDAVNGPKEI